MIVLHCEQGSSEWHKARLGIPTASSFEKILTPTGKVSTQAEGYMRKLLAEYFLGEPSDAGASQFMDRGTRLEESARARYSLDNDVDVEQVGIILRDDKLVGASPDSLVGDDGLLELKCPAAHTQIGYLQEGRIDGYWSQCQGQLLISGRKWVDLYSWNPVLPPVTMRIERDEEYLEKLTAALKAFINQMLFARARLVELGCRPATRLLIPTNMATDPEPF